MSTVYVVRPDQRGISTYPSWGIEHACMTPPRIDIFSVEQPFLPPAVQRCTVRPNSVCEHGWFCTDNRDVAAMVNELRGERAAVVEWLRDKGHAWVNAEVVMLADFIDRGEHRREEER